MLSFRSGILIAIIPIAIAAARSEIASATLREITAQDVREEMARDLEFHERLNEEHRSILRQIEMKERLLSELIAGRETLPSVTAEFRMMNEPHPEYQFVIDREFPGETIDEKTARSVIAFAEAELAGRFPTRRLPVLVRLESEFQTHFVSARSAPGACSH